MPYIPILILGGIIVAAFSAVTAARAAVALAATGNFVAVLAGTARQCVLRHLEVFLRGAFVTMGVSIIFVFVGISIPASFIWKSVLVALGSIIFGVFMALMLYYNLALVEVLRVGLEFLQGVWRQVARVMFAILQAFQVSLPPDDRSADGNQSGKPFRQWVSDVLVIPAIIWSLFTCLLVSWPTWTGMGVAMVLGAFLLAWHGLVHKRAEPIKFWRWCVKIFLPIMLAVWVLKAFAPGVLPTVGYTVSEVGAGLGRGSRKAAIAVSCTMDSSTPACEKRAIGLMASDLRNVVGETADAVAAGSRVGVFAKAVRATMWTVLFVSICLFIGGVLQRLIARGEIVAARVEGGVNVMGRSTMSSVEVKTMRRLFGLAGTGFVISVALAVIQRFLV